MTVSDLPTPTSPAGDPPAPAAFPSAPDAVPPPPAGGWPPPGAGQLPPPAPAPAPRRWSGGRIASAVIGTFVILGSIVLLVVGGILLLADRGLRAEDGYFTSAGEGLRTDTYAIVSEGIDLGSVGPMWGTPDRLLGDARLRARSVSGEPLFIGIASPADVDAYLADVRHAVVTEIADPATTYIEQPGGAPTVAPADADIWIAQSSGTGTQDIVWPLRQGAWAVVVMNADGSAGVDVTADVGATFPLMTGLAGGMVAGGLLGLLVGVLLVVVPAVQAGRAGRAAASYAPAGSPR
jgi:hypothetical protein